MREILFRGKHMANGQWCEGNLAVRKNGIAIITPDDTPCGVYGQVRPDTVGQYTGLTDKNGKKIFEGDIMRLCQGAHPCLVYWDGRGWAWMQNGKRRDIDLTREMMQVIGNIHDNPELLNGGAPDGD